MIQKNIFQSWYTKNLDLILEEKVINIKKMNPLYKYYLYDDNDMEKFVKENYDPYILECYNKLNIIVAKVDFWRYLVLYKYGGIYIDMDSSIEKPLDELIKQDDDAIITAEGNPNMYVQWALIFSKNHIILKKCIELICDNIKNNKYPNDIIKMTGPYVYSNAINTIHKELFGDFINHKEINEYTDNTYSLNNISYRIYGIDYNEFFSFRYPNSYNILYKNKKHWRIEQKEKQLLI